jgi:hypothetical protein
MLRILIISLLAASVIAAEAEPRWCSITGKAAADKISYPPIAKAARVEGVVVSRIIFEPNGKVERFEAVFGPPMLFKFLEQAMSSWSLVTDARGYETCETLVIARFQFKEPPSCNPAPDVPTEYDFSTPSILRLSLGANPYLICDPASTVTSISPWRVLFYRLKRGFRRPFRGREPLVPML